MQSQLTTINGSLSTLNSSVVKKDDVKDKGSATKPVYFNPSGIAQECTGLDSSFFGENIGVITTKYSSGANGYVVFSNNLCIQWGTFAKNTSYTQVSLLRNFSNANYCVVTTPNTDSVSNAVDTGGITYAAWIFPAYSKTTSSFRVKALSTGQWIAIGY